MTRMLFFLLLLAVIALGLSFAVENAHQVEFNYFVASKSVPLSLLMVSVLFVGTLLGIFANIGLVITLKSQVRVLKCREAVVEKERTNQRTSTLRDSL